MGRLNFTATSVELLGRVTSKDELSLGFESGNEIEQPKLLVTLNLSHLRISCEKPHYLEILQNADYIIADGAPIVWLSNFFLGKKVARYTGVEFVRDYLEKEDDYFVIGSTHENISKTFYLQQFMGADKLDLRYCDDRIELNDKSKIVELASKLNLSKPKIVLLALGVPKQDELYFAMKKLGNLPSALFVGIGGTFEILSGKYPRAPRMIQTLGLEWLWRTAHEPKRLLPRYFKDGFWLMKFLCLRLFVNPSRVK